MLAARPGRAPGGVGAYVLKQKRSVLREEIEALKRRQILQEARRLFFTMGYHGTTMDAISEALGMGKPFLYRHFPTKLDLLTELYDQAISMSEDALHRALESGNSPETTIRDFVRNYLEVVVTEREIVTIFFRESANVPAEKMHVLNEHKRTFDNRLTTVIQAGIDEGCFSVPSARLSVYAVVGMVNWSYQWYRAEGKLTPAELGDIFADFALAILGASGAVDRGTPPGLPAP